MILCILESDERLTLSAEAAGSICSSIVDDTHRLVARVTWQFDLIVLNNILLNNSLSRLLTLRLINAPTVEVNLRDEAVVARDVLCHFGRAYA